MPRNKLLNSARSAVMSSLSLMVGVGLGNIYHFMQEETKMHFLVDYSFQF